jgi:hypothetical protein
MNKNHVLPEFFMLTHLKRNMDDINLLNKRNQFTKSSSYSSSLSSSHFPNSHRLPYALKMNNGNIQQFDWHKNSDTIINNWSMNNTTTTSILAENQFLSICQQDDKGKDKEPVFMYNESDDIKNVGIDSYDCHDAMREKHMLVLEISKVSSEYVTQKKRIISHVLLHA